MSCADSDPSLSARRRAALRFDLEDRQIELIDELHGLADSLFGPLRAATEMPDGWRPSLAGTDDRDSLAGLRRLDRQLTTLFRVNRALARIDGPEYGRCSACDAPISFDALAADPTRMQCAACDSSRDSSNGSRCGANSMED
jgi:DnaK suppressor protein